jgi:hypothetical protein
LGFQFRADQINSHLMAGYRWTKPSRLLRSARLNVARFRTYNFGGDVTWDGYFLAGAFQLHNFSTGRWSVAYNPQSLSDRRTRGGPLTINPSGLEWDFQSESDPNRRWVYGFGLHGTHYRLGSDESWSANGALEWKPGSRVTLRVEPKVERVRTSAQYVDTFDDQLAGATYGHRYVFAGLDQTCLRQSPAELDLQSAAESGSVFSATGIVGCLSRLQGAGGTSELSVHPISRSGAHRGPRPHSRRS